MPSSEAHGVQPPRSILVGVELQKQDGAAAVAVACAYAARLGAEVILLGTAVVAEPVLTDGMLGSPGPSMAMAITEQRALDRLAEEQLAEVAASAPAGVACRTVLSWGPLGPALVETAETEGADLIAVPIHGGGAIEHLLHDGADRYVLHHSPVPVLVVPTAAAA